MAENVANIKNANRPVGHIRWTIVLMVFGFITFDYIDRGLVTSALPVLTSEFHLTPLLQAMIGDGFTYGYLIMNPVVGYILDRYGSRLAVTRFGLGWGTVQAITAGAFSAAYLVIARVFLGIMEAVGFPGVTKITAEWMPRQEKARSGTIGDSGVNVGIILGSLLLLGMDLIIPTSVAWRYALLISGALTILLSFSLIFILYDTPEKHPKISKEELEYIRTNQEKAVEQTKAPVSSWFKTRDYWGSMMGLGAQAGIFFGLLTWLPLYLYEARHFTLTFTLAYTALIWGFGFIGEITGGFVIDYINRTHGQNIGMKIGFTVSSLGVTVGLLATALAKSPILAVEILAVTFFFLRWSGIQWAVSSFLVPKEYAGQWGGHIGFWETLWGIIVPLAFGALLSVTHRYALGIYMFVLIGVVYFVGTVIVTRYRPLLLKRAVPS
ncbi:MAG: MFS transporter [Thermoplasmata archaeon]